MPHDATATDSELLGSWAIDAIGSGKLQLAEALIRLANQARRVESATLVPMAGRTRDEQPVRPYLVPQHIDGPTLVPMAGRTRDEQPVRPYLVPQHIDGPTGNGDADLKRAEAAATSIFGAVREQHLDVPESARCVAFVIDSGHETSCDHPIYWAHGGVGDLTGPAVSAGWFHVDPKIDQHHAAVRG
jgi:hypothetical protein